MNHTRHTESERKAFTEGWGAKHKLLTEQLEEYKQALRELIPIAERMANMCAYRGKGEYNYKKDGDEYKATIDKARKLLNSEQKTSDKGDRD